MSFQNVQPKIVQIMKAYQKPQLSIPFLLQLHSNQSESNKKIVQKAIYLLLDSQHDWENITKYLVVWKNHTLAIQFCQKMIKRCEQDQLSTNTFSTFQSTMKQVDRLIQKYWMTFSQKKPKIQYKAHKTQAPSQQNQNANANSKVSRPGSNRSIILNTKTQNKNIISKSQTFQNQRQIPKTYSNVQTPASLQNLSKLSTSQKNFNSKNSSGFPQNDNSNTISVGLGQKKGLQKSMNIFKLLKKQDKSKQPKKQRQQQFQSPPRSVHQKSQAKISQKRQVVQNNKQLSNLVQTEKLQKQPIERKQFNDMPKLKSLKKPIGLSPYKPEIRHKKFTIKGAFQTSNSITDSADRLNSKKFDEFQNDFSFEQTGPKLIFQSSRKKNQKEDKIDQYKQLQQDLKNQKFFQNPQSSSLSSIKNSGLNLHMSNNSKSIFARGSKNDPTSLFSPEQLRLINFDKGKQNNPYVNFHKRAEKIMGIDIWKMFEQTINKI